MMNVAMILGLFPAFMAMIAVYYILKAIGLSEGSMIRVALVLVYSASAGIQFYIAKGFFDTIPKTIDEAALIDGATKWQVFTKITIPLSKPIIVYTVLTSFIAPWVDFIFARVICRANADYYTVAIGLWQMLEKEYVDVWYTRFAAGAVLISIPIAALFMIMQKCYNESMSEQLKADRNRWKNIMFVHHQINNNSGINIIYKQSSTICIAKLLYTIMMLTVITLLAGCNSPAKGVYNDSDYNEAVSTAKTTPFGAYPDTIEYTLGKMTSVNNSNMPAMDTYTDNAYTRYIKSVLNVQNVDVFEANDSQYNTNVSMAVSMNRLPILWLCQARVSWNSL